MQTAKRLDLLTIGIGQSWLVNLLFDLVDRFMPNMLRVARPSLSSLAVPPDAGRDVLWATRQLVEIDRLQ